MNERTVTVGIAFVAIHGDKMNREMTEEIMAASGLSDGALEGMAHKLEQSVGERAEWTQ